MVTRKYFFLYQELAGKCHYYKFNKHSEDLISYLVALLILSGRNDYQPNITRLLEGPKRDHDIHNFPLLSFLFHFTFSLASPNVTPSLFLGSVTPIEEKKNFFLYLLHREFLPPRLRP